MPELSALFRLIPYPEKPTHACSKNKERTSPDHGILKKPGNKATNAFPVTNGGYSPLLGDFSIKTACS